MVEDEERCYRAVQSRDARFDGWFFTAVVTTGIYCRPSCPAVTPKRQNMRFYPTAAAAQQAGFRACKRCRPDARPARREWNVRADVVARAMRLIADGVVDREGVPGLAPRLGYSDRQLNRQLIAELGAGPLALARAQRAQTARLLIETTDLPMAEVAFAAGFAQHPPVQRHRPRGVRPHPGRAAARRRRDRRRRRRARRRSRCGCRTAAVRRRRRCSASSPPAPCPASRRWRDGAYRRTLRLPHGTAIVALRPAAGPRALPRCGSPTCATSPSPCSAAAGCSTSTPTRSPSTTCWAPTRCWPRSCARPRPAGPRHRRRRESPCGPCSASRSRSPAPRTLAGRLVAALGEPLRRRPDGGLTHLFPTAEALAATDPTLWRCRPAARTLRALAAALADGDVVLDPGADRDEARRRLGALPGIGPWTAGYIAMRGARRPRRVPPHRPRRAPRARARSAATPSPAPVAARASAGGRGARTPCSTCGPARAARRSQGATP